MRLKAEPGTGSGEVRAFSSNTIVYSRWESRKRRWTIDHWIITFDDLPADGPS